MLKVLSYYLIPFICLGSFSLAAQTDRAKNSPKQMLWFAYYNKVQINQKWLLASDIQFRTTNGIQELAQALLRTGLFFKANKLIQIGGGFASFQYFANDKISRSEWRPFEEAYLKKTLNKLKVNSRLRVEERFFAPTTKISNSLAYRFYWRFRYQLDVEYQIYKKGSHELAILAGNEIMINKSPNPYKGFDQNRIYSGINYGLNKNIFFSVQYMYVLQSQSSSNLLTKVNSIRINFYHTI